jgi:hypothetical protein
MVLLSPSGQMSREYFKVFKYRYAAGFTHSSFVIIFPNFIPQYIISVVDAAW